MSFHVSSILRSPEDANAGGRVVAVLPAYNASRTLERTLADIPPGVVDDVILVDDASRDGTADLAESMGLQVVRHEQNRGYGANQKTCYLKALDEGADFVVMIHPDYQYDSRVVPLALGFIRLGICDVVLGSRIRTRREALDGGMPLIKYLANRALTTIENVSLGQNLGDFHSGFRAYRREVLQKVPFSRNSDDFVFDSQFLVQSVALGFRLGDVPVPVRYFNEASSINFWRSSVYAIETLWAVARYGAHWARLWRSPLFEPASSEPAATPEHD
ncbi:Undecaprenyl-phosphate mannosyltransferase [Planctomycetes bacterium Pan216]|uniref:Undecaprenyl-phosphate mannosyltransferase n=1 Tax=Kolteria novifilia TaxID=2527975 RepID=A0A518B3G2_9BACT|nr:Undecaprenyl-phosphate mannosyltransferase [Planctomycetes bacterium Pan216]